MDLVTNAVSAEYDCMPLMGDDLCEPAASIDVVAHVVTEARMRSRQVSEPIIFMLDDIGSLDLARDLPMKIALEMDLAGVIDRSCQIAGAIVFEGGCAPIRK